MERDPTSSIDEFSWSSICRTFNTSKLFSGASTPPSYFSGPSTPPNYSSGSSRNAECSNCKHLHGKISVLKATMDMHMHSKQHTVNLAALLREVLNEMEKLDLEGMPTSCCVVFGSERYAYLMLCGYLDRRGYSISEDPKEEPIFEEPLEEVKNEG
nr:hypothetical protein [Tanacetum cinerariifolium]